MNEADIRHAPAAERNQEAILDVLRQHLPVRGRVLEVASGTGQHVIHFAAALPGLSWQPSDPDAGQRASIRARIAAAGLDNVDQPVDLDVRGSWPPMDADAVITANLLHVSPPETLEALCIGAAGVLVPGGLLHVYGPFNRDGAYTSEGNARFDAALRAENPAWGIRDLESLVAAAADSGLGLSAVLDMPANNLSVVFARND